MLFKRLIIFISILFFPVLAISQEETLSRLDEIIEEIASATDSELDYTTLFDALEKYWYDPIDLNQATETQLKELLFLNEFQIYSIIKYRTKYGNFMSLYELQFVDGIDLLTLKRLLPFVTVGDVRKTETLDLKKALTYGKNVTFLRYQQTLQQKVGYIPIPDSILAINPDKSRYLGSPYKLYFRHSFQFKNRLLFGITAEKDDGEQFFRGAQKYGFDFYSAHLQVNNVWKFKKIIVGDYLAQFGQGLTLWSGLSFGKTSSLSGVMKKARGINKYSSVNETSFFRGQAATISFGKFSFTEFISYKKIDGTITSISDTTDSDILEEQYITSFLETGYHRTPSEIKKRKTISEFVTGFNTNYTLNRFKIGATGVYYNYSVPMGSRTEPYRLFDFTGSSNSNFGVDYIYTQNKLILFGETSLSQNFGWASLNGALIDFVPEFKMSLVHRYYRPDYQNMYANPFSEGNKAYNESGLFIGAEIFPRKYWKIETFFDSWNYPWLRYGVNSPSTGNDMLVQLSYFPKRNLDMYFRYRNKTKQKNNSEITSGIRPLTDYSTTRYRYHLNYVVNKNLTLKSRVELSNYKINERDDWGFMIYQDFQYKPDKLPLTFTARVAVFEIDSYDAAIYAYEPDVLYGFSVPAYYGQGIRNVFLVKYTASKNLDFWLRISNTYFNDRDYISSGLDKINGRNKTDVKLQLRYKF